MKKNPEGGGSLLSRKKVFVAPKKRKSDSKGEIVITSHPTRKEKSWAVSSEGEDSCLTMGTGAWRKERRRAYVTRSKRAAICNQAKKKKGGDAVEEKTDVGGIAESRKGPIFSKKAVSLMLTEKRALKKIKRR